jgi:hypothetical protein
MRLDLREWLREMFGSVVWTVTFVGGPVIIVAGLIAFSKHHPWVWLWGVVAALLLLLVRSFFLFHNAAEASRTSLAGMLKDRQKLEAHVKQLETLSAAQVQATARQVDPYRNTLRNVHVVDSGGDGIHIEGGTFDIDQMSATRSGGQGIYFAPSRPEPPEPTEPPDEPTGRRPPGAN